MKSHFEKHPIWKRAEVLTFKEEWPIAKNYFAANPDQLFFSSVSGIQPHHIYFKMENSLVRLDTQKKLGEGMYGMVFEAINEQGKLFALKIAAKSKQYHQNRSGEEYSQEENEQYQAYLRNIKSQKEFGVLHAYAYSAELPQPITLPLQSKGYRNEVDLREYDYSLISLYKGKTLEKWVEEMNKSSPQEPPQKDAIILLLNFVEILETNMKLNLSHTDIHEKNLMVVKGKLDWRLVIIDIGALKETSYPSFDSVALNNIQNYLAKELNLNLPELLPTMTSKEYKQELLCNLSPQKRRAMHYEIPLDVLMQHAELNDYSVPFESTIIIPQEYQLSEKEHQYLSDLKAKCHISLKHNFENKEEINLSNVGSTTRYKDKMKDHLQSNAEKQEIIGTHRKI